MPSPAREDVVMKPVDNEAMAEVGEPSQPDDVPPGRHPGHQQALPTKPTGLLVSNGDTGLAKPVRPNLPQASHHHEDTDDNMSFGNASGTSSVSIPIQIQSTSLKQSYPSLSIHSNDRRPSGASSASSHSLARADSTDSARRSSARPLDVSRSVRNGAPTSPMPLYSQQLLGGQQISRPSPCDSGSELELEELKSYTLNIEQSLSSLKRKRPHPKDEPSGLPTADSDVIAATQDVVALLQIYGPLSYIQLKVNIETQFEGEDDNSLSVKKLQKVLDILVELGVIHILEDENERKSAATTAAAAGGENSKPDATNNPVYCIGSGTRRIDAVLPRNILDEINESSNELSETNKRIGLLQSFLQADQSTAGAQIKTSAPLTQEHARQALRQMMEHHPDVVHDPTYVAALRLFKVHDVSQHSKMASSAEGANSGSKNKKRKSTDSAVDAIAKSKAGNESPLVDSKRSESC